MGSQAAGHGRFPFGAPNSARPMRRATSQALALVVGVYPSAFHVAWSPPESLDPRPIDQRRRPLVSSLAVDVEPVVFWDGISPSPADRLAAWKAEVGFDEGRQGVVRPGHNGPSGGGVVTGVLTPLGLTADQVAFTDAVPWYFVKNGKGSQGEAIETRFNSLASSLGVEAGDLPSRPTPRALVAIATSGARRDGLRNEIAEAGAPLVITLGQEALDAVRGVADRCEGVQEKLAPDGYGHRGEIEAGGARAELLPLVHPGFQRQTSSAPWRDALMAWSSR